MSTILDSFSLAGKTALVTGGAGLYGRQIVAAVAEAGARTFIAARDLEKLEIVAAQERARGYDVTAHHLDLGSDQSIEKLHADIIAAAGKCDILINNAVTRSAISGWDHDLDAYDKSLHVNASALFKITHLFSQNMRQNRSGSIINIGSMMGSVGVEMHNYVGTDMMANPSPIYHYEKGGMLNFSRWAASILGPDNVRVNCLAPGGFLSGQPEKFVKNYSDRTQLGRMANDTDLKGAIVFLASDASAYITGANIPVDGGYTAK
ncbi:SDR family oxidoreductase [Devosia rhodophyticola]|uniref:SDR family oxidoreductase n=1 Tax=Devosia rhodophyticola TaxID=3026423 RepID=A0ABY7YXW5_9HYPH|nr:SDR family oxidoreductase [Devosia rhodophyticola]WDR06201.1 SDR family oxidoreductase [Devosia rhodophyticola]